ncbi:hypothetical protein BLNAU_8658 [Blattamonas nauphoetae]|uniref:Uncharacterized protein n=1 Tax=Blattamonas nauphoetae TaxID=2049346 RepID=A0ABQ9XY57_9EUKA|nr:hypothetical protein BLNAU_8658 [Blattamonas nauphoetae]
MQDVPLTAVTLNPFSEAGFQMKSNRTSYEYAPEREMTTKTTRTRRLSDNQDDDPFTSHLRQISLPPPDNQPQHDPIPDIITDSPHWSSPSPNTNDNAVTENNIQILDTQSQSFQKSRYRNPSGLEDLGFSSTDTSFSLRTSPRANQRRSGVTTQLPTHFVHLRSPLVHNPPFDRVSLNVPHRHKTDKFSGRASLPFTDSEEDLKLTRRQRSGYPLARSDVKPNVSLQNTHAHSPMSHHDALSPPSFTSHTNYSAQTTFDGFAPSERNQIAPFLYRQQTDGSTDLITRSEDDRDGSAWDSDTIQPITPHSEYPHNSSPTNKRGQYRKRHPLTSANKTVASFPVHFDDTPTMRIAPKAHKKEPTERTDLCDSPHTSFSSALSIIDSTVHPLSSLNDYIFQLSSKPSSEHTYSSLNSPSMSPISTDALPSLETMSVHPFDGFERVGMNEDYDHELHPEANGSVDVSRSVNVTVGGRQDSWRGDSVDMSEDCVLARTVLRHDQPLPNDLGSLTTLQQSGITQTTPVSTQHRHVFRFIPFEDDGDTKSMDQAQPTLTLSEESSFRVPRSVRRRSSAFRIRSLSAEGLCSKEDSEESEGRLIDDSQTMPIPLSHLDLSARDPQRTRSRMVISTKQDAATLRSDTSSLPTRTMTRFLRRTATRKTDSRRNGRRELRQKEVRTGFSLGNRIQTSLSQKATEQAIFRVTLCIHQNHLSRSIKASPRHYPREPVHHHPNDISFHEGEGNRSENITTMEDLFIRLPFLAAVDDRGISFLSDSSHNINENDLSFTIAMTDLLSYQQTSDESLSVELRPSCPILSSFLHESVTSLQIQFHDEPNMHRFIHLISPSITVSRSIPRSP